MAGLGKGLKALVGSVTPPKKDINPLLKQMEEIFTSPDSDLFDKGPNSETELVGRFYSPVYSAIEKMPIGKEGTKGENIMGYLNKRAPNVDKSELESFNINLDPNKKYTREEILTLAKEKGSPDYTIEKQKYTDYEDTQRQNVSDKEVEYAELILQGKQDYTKHSTKTHFGGKKNIGHSRVSIREEMPEGGPLSQKTVDRPRYLLIEELQSDLAKVRDDLPNEENPITNYYNQDSPFDPNIDIEQFNREVFYPKLSRNFDDLIEELEDIFNIYVDKNVVATIKDFYSTTFDPELIDSIDDFKKIYQDDTYKNQLIKTLKDKHNIDAAGRDIETVSLDAIRKKSDTSSGETDWSSDGERELSPDEVLEREVKGALIRTKTFIDNLYLTGAPKSQLNLEEIQTLPVATRTEYVKRLLLANIAYAKQNNINKIVIPNYKEIASQRVDTFSTVLSSRNWNTSDPLVQKYKKAREKGKEVEVAQEYFEGVFKPIYEDAVKKVLNGLKTETKNAIKTKPKELKYPDLTQPSGFRTSNSLEIDITELDYNPKTSAFRFNEGGVVNLKQGVTPMLKQQMELFRRGGLNDEGGEIDEVSGNEVPIGGTKKGVRDDVPAMVSEGEFVFPEDVVRYIGLDKLMQLRQQAKMGLKKMEAMGQMGNGDEATIPDDLPFDMADLIIVAGDTGEELEMQEGGFVIRPTTVRRTTQQPTYAQPPAVTMPYERPVFRSVRALTPTIPRPAPSVINFDKLMGDARINFKEYRNESGQSILIPFLGGSPIFPIPQGYSLYQPSAEETTTEKQKVVETINEALANAPRDSSESRSSSAMVKNKFTEAGSWEGVPLDMYIKEATKFVDGTSSLATGIMGAFGGLPMGLFTRVAASDQKKRILATIDKRIQEAMGTPIEGQVAQLRKIKAILEGKEAPAGAFDKVKSIVNGILAPEGVKQQTVKVAANSPVKIETPESDAALAEQVQQYILSGDGTSPELAGIMQDVADYEMGRPTRITQETINQIEQLRAMERQGVDPLDISQVPPVPTQAVRPAPQIGELPAAPTMYQSPEEVYTDLERGLITRGGQPIQYLDEKDIAREAYSKQAPSQPYEFFESVQLPPETGGMLRDGSAQPIDPLRRLKEEERQRRTARIQAEDPIAKRAQLASIYQTPSVVAGQPVVIPPTPIVTQTEPVSAYDFTPTTETSAIEQIRTKYTGDPYTYPTTDITKAPYQTPLKRLLMDQPEGTKYQVPGKRLLTSGYEMPQGTFGQRMGTVGFKDTQNQMETLFPDQTISGPKADEVSQMPDPYAYMFETPKKAVPTTVAPVQDPYGIGTAGEFAGTPTLSIPTDPRLDLPVGTIPAESLAPDVSLRPKARPTKVKGLGAKKTDDDVIPDTFFTNLIGTAGRLKSEVEEENLARSAGVSVDEYKTMSNYEKSQALGGSKAADDRERQAFQNKQQKLIASGGDVETAFAAEIAGVDKKERRDFINNLKEDYLRATGQLKD